MEKKQKQNHRKTAILRRLLSLVIAGSVVAGGFWTAYSGLPAVSIKAAETYGSGAGNTVFAAAGEEDSADSFEGMVEQVEEDALDAGVPSFDANSFETGNGSSSVFGSGDIENEDDENEAEENTSDADPGGETVTVPGSEEDQSDAAGLTDTDAKGTDYRVEDTDSGAEGVETGAEDAAAGLEGAETGAENADTDAKDVNAGTENMDIGAEAAETGAETLEEAGELNEQTVFLSGKLTAEMDDAAVTAEFTEAAAIPAGAELRIRRVGTVEELYVVRYEQTRAWVESKYGKYVISDRPEEPEKEEKSDKVRDEAGEKAGDGEKKLVSEGDDSEENDSEKDGESEASTEQTEKIENSLKNENEEKADEGKLDEGKEGEEKAGEEELAEGKLDGEKPDEEKADKEKDNEEKPDEENGEREKEPSEPGGQEEEETAEKEAGTGEEKHVSEEDDSGKKGESEVSAEDAAGPDPETKRVEFISPTEEMSDAETAVLPDLQGAEVRAFALFDLSFVYKGAELEPQDSVLVTLKFSGEDFAEQGNLALIHYGESIEVIAEQAFSGNRKGEVEGWFKADSFSEYAVIALEAPDPAALEKKDDNPGMEPNAETPEFTESKAEEPAEGKAEEAAEGKAEDKTEIQEKGILKGGELTAEADGVIVTITFNEAAGLPEGTELRVRKIEPDEKGYTERLDGAKEWVDAKYGNSDREQKGSAPLNSVDEESKNSKNGAEEADPEAAEAADAMGHESRADDQEGEIAGVSETETLAAGGMTETEAAVLPAVPESKTAEITAFALFDIALVCDGKEIEPLESVRVTIRFAGEDFSKEQEPVVIHYAEEEKQEAKTIEVVPEQKSKSGEGGEVEVSFSADSFSEYAVMAVRAGPYTVWFDGTDGMGTARSLVRGATNTSVTVYSNTVVLPLSAGTNNINKYKLNGWYDINTGAYYKPGDTATISGNTVFYAEWIQQNYSPNPSSTVVTGQPNISSFVTTKVFDYNEIFNPYHGAALSSSWVNGGGHDETWRDTRNTGNGGDFLFTNWYHQYYENNGKYLGFVTNLQDRRNRYVGAGDITPGIVSSTDDDLMTDLFEESDAPGKVYLGEGNMLYQYDNNPSSNRYGYYYYDSEKNAADYNQNDQRFYIYRNTQTIRGEWGDLGTNVTGFMPFEPGTATINQKTGQVNFWFGMVSTVNFFLPDDPGSGGNKATGGKDMEFYFSGDDDVWVFVDGVLLLDLGGIHRTINGSINFSDGNIYVEGDRVASIPDSIRSGDHQLQFYYLERGSSWSNASIYFNIAPRYSLELLKSDADHPDHFLEGAAFNVYADAGCTIPAYLWTSKDAYDSGEDPVNTFTTGADGRVSCYGLYANRTYYLKEISAPPGYPSISDRVIALQLNAFGEAAISEGGDIALLIQDGATKKIDLSVTNDLPETIDIPVQKHWYNQDGSPMSGGDDIEVELYQAEIDIPSGGDGGSGGGSGGTPGTVLPVNIRTQFFRVGGYNSNGSNSDTSGLYPGDLTANAIVTQGGSLTLNLDVTTAEAAVYSVTVNGKSVNPVSTSSPTTTQCHIGGRWGNYPPRHAVYVIDPVEEALDIRVTMIGYLNYGGQPHHPDTSYSMNITATTTEPAADPGTGSGEPEEPEAPEIPSVMPEGAVLFRTATLSATGGWEYVFTDLPARNDDGTKLFVYYVKEIYPDGFSTSYIGNGSIGGSISIYNVRLREITVKKEWLDFNGIPLTEGLPESIDLVLTQYDDTAGTSREIPVTLTADNGWQKKWRSNNSELNEQEGHSYRYRVTEVDISNEYTVTYSQNNQEGITEGTLIATNRRKAYPVSFVKADSTDHNITLSGAEFSIYSDPECMEEDIVEAYDSDSETAEIKTVFISRENGGFEIYGLRAGTYYLKELSAPEGYYLINYPLEIVITDEAGGVASVRGVCMVEGMLTEVQEETLRIELVQESILRVKVYDSPLFELPSTGGTGSWMFIVGGIAVMFAVLLLNIKQCNISSLL